MVTPARYFEAMARLFERLPLATIDRIADLLAEAYHDNRAVYFFGNGGSAALASHAACDLGKGTVKDGQRRFRVLALTDNVPLLTAWANDFGYQHVFAEQLRHFVCPKDISFAISGSGNSLNVLNGLRASREGGAINIGLTGFQGGGMKGLCDVCLIVPSENMQLVENLHLAIMHSIYYALCQRIFPRARPAAGNAPGL